MDQHRATTQPHPRAAALPAAATALAALLAVTACSDGGGSSDPCDGVSCSMYGTCITDGNLPFCSCQAGYHPIGLDCVPNDPADPCRDVTCNLHGTCRPESGLPVCDCEPGYRRDASGLLCFPVPTDADADADVEPDGPDADADADVEPDGPDADADVDGAVVVECTTNEDCEDYNVCTDDACSPEGRCRYVAVTDDSPCPSDGNECTLDVCRRGACSHRPLVDGSACATDDNECTDDVCVAGTCAHPALTDGSACFTDGNECTDDVCVAGACAHEPTPGASCADDGNACTAETCGTTGECLHEPIPGCCNVAADCDDGNPCTVDACNDATHACRPPVTAADGTTCGFLGETCFAGRCAREVIVNGAFDSGDTAGWTLQDASYRGEPCTGYYGDWSVTGGRLQLHGHSATGIAVASQAFPAARPLRVRFDYELTTSCGDGSIALHDGGTMLLNWDRSTYFSGRGKDVVTYYTPFLEAAPGTCLTEPGGMHRSDYACEQVSGAFCYRAGCAVSTMAGTFEAVFDWATNLVTMRAGGVTLGSYRILDPATFRVAQVRWTVGHGCCDSRWDSYFAIDNVSLLVEAP